MKKCQKATALTPISRSSAVCALSRPATVNTNFHGMLQFYTYDSKTMEWWCYEAKFTDGRCVEIACVEYEHREL